VIEKPGRPGEYGEIHDLRVVNAWLLTMRYRSDRPDTVQDVALIGDFATKLDIKGAFQHVKVCRAMRLYLCFAFKGEYYAHRVLPFGLKLSLKYFTEALGYGVKYIREHWNVRMVVYMDDVLLLHQDKVYLELVTAQIAAYLQSLGWTFALDKCAFIAEHVITYLGWRWSFDKLEAQMTREFRARMMRVLKVWLRRTVQGASVSCRQLGSLIRSLNFLRPQFPRASLYLSELHAALTKGVKQSGWHGCLCLPQRISSELKYWWRNVAYNEAYEFRRRIF
jgi:hypothetical protein